MGSVFTIGLKRTDLNQRMGRNVHLFAEYVRHGWRPEIDAQQVSIAAPGADDLADFAAVTDLLA